MGLALQFAVRREGALVGAISTHQSPCRIGSGEDDQVHLEDPEIIAGQVEILEGPSDIVVARDTSNRGGIVINGVRLVQAEVRPGDVLTVGPFELHVVEAHVMREVVNPDTYVDASGDPDTKGKPVVEVYVLWRERLLQVDHLDIPATFNLGTGKNADLLLPGDLIVKLVSYALISQVRGGPPVLDASMAGFKGEVRSSSGAKRTVEEVRERSKGIIELGSGVRARLDLGQFTFLVSATRARVPAKPAWSQRIDAAVAVFLAISLLGHMTFMIGLTLVPEDPLLLSQARYQRRKQVVEFIQIAQKMKEKEEEKEVQKIKAKRKTDEEKPGDERIKTKKKETVEITSHLTPEQRKKKTKELVLKTGLAKEMNDQRDLLSEVLDANVITAGNETLKAIAAQGGAGDDYVASGLDPFGGALGQPGGGGMLGTLPGGGSSGGGLAVGAASYGLGKDAVEKDKVNVKFKKTKASFVKLSSGVQITGGYDKGVIRQYIRTRLSQLKWCHQRLIQRKSEVGGKIVVEFWIGPNGKVMRAKVHRSTVNEPTLEACIVEKISMWHFPPPRTAGTTARVRYPFLFKVVK